MDGSAIVHRNRAGRAHQIFSTIHIERRQILILNVAGPAPLCIVQIKQVMIMTSRNNPHRRHVLRDIA